MSQLTRKEIDLFSKKILEDYDANNPSTIFKDKMKINNSDALIIQSTVTKLREKRGEEVIGFKIGCVLKETQKKWVLPNQLGALFGKKNFIKMELC